MKEQQIKELTKYGKFVIYLLLTVIIIVLALFLFQYSNIVYTTLLRSPEFINVEEEFYYLFLFMILLLVIPFTAFFILSVIELSKLMGQLRNKIIEQKLDSQSDFEEKEELSDEENIQKKKEISAQQEQHYKNLEDDIKECLKENISKSNDHIKISESVLSCIGKFYEITQGELYLRQTDKKKDKLVLSATYAYFIPEEKIFEFDVGEGLIGQVAKQGELICLDNIPEGYITVASGLGSATPSNMIIFPIIRKKDKYVIGVIEIASFKAFEQHDVKLFKNIGEEIEKYFGNVDIVTKNE